MLRGKLETNDNEDGTITVKGNCVFSGVEYSATYPLEGFKKWQEGEMIQTAMPKISIENREFLISGISPAGWKKAFGK